MKNILFLFVCVLSAFGLSAQTLTQRTLSNGGGNLANANFSVSYTVGEMVVQTISSASNSLTAGFQQPNTTNNQPPDDTTTLRFTADKVSGLTGDTVSVPIRVFNFKDIVVFQKSIHLADTSVGVIVGTSGYNLTNLGATNFFLVAGNTLTSVWENQTGNGSTLADSSIIYNLRVKLKGAAGTMTNVTMDSLPTVILAAKKIGNTISTVAVATTTGMVSVLSTVNLSGRIAREDSQTVALVKVNLSGFVAPTQTTTANGLYSFLSVDASATGGITPSKRINPRNGVNALDIYFIRRHILNAELLASPYKIIAADVNRDATVSGLDLVFIQQLILTQIDSFPNNTPSWRFVPKSFVFPQPTNPLGTVFPDSLAYTGSGGNAANRDFVAIKVGDVNLDNTTNSLTNVQENASSDDDLELWINDEMLPTKSSLVSIPLKIARDKNLVGCQFTLSFDRDLLELVGTVSGEATVLSKENFYTEKKKDGWLTFAWASASGTPTPFLENSSLLNLTFRVKKAAQNLRWNQVVRLNSDRTTAQSYDAHARARSVRLTAKADPTTTDRFEVFPNEPNPFNIKTLLRYRLPQATEVTLRVLDAQGKTMHFEQQNGTKGNNHFSFEPSDRLASGVYFYQITTADGKQMTQKMTLFR